MTANTVKSHHNKAYMRIKEGCTASATTIYLSESDIIALFENYDSTKEFYLTITNNVKDIEIIKVTAINDATGALTIERGQDGTIAQQWYADDALVFRLVADHLDSFVQKGGYREYAINPNGILTANYRGEKVLQPGYAWFKNISGTTWKIIAGQENPTTLVYLDGDDQGDLGGQNSYWDGTFLYVPFRNGSGGIRVYSIVDDELVLVKENTFAFLYRCGSIYSDGNFFYFGWYTSGGNHYFYSLTFDGSGTATVIDTLDKFDGLFGLPYQMYSDGTFLYAIQGQAGVCSYSVDGSGNITPLDTVNPDSNTNLRGLYSDGTFFFVGTAANGLFVYTVDGSGNFTQTDSIATPSLGVTGDGTYIYSAGNSNHIDVYTVNGDGELTYKSTYTLSGSLSARAISYLKGLVLTVDNAKKLSSLYVNDSGVLTLSQELESVYSISGPLSAYDDYVISPTLNNGVYLFGWE